MSEAGSDEIQPAEVDWVAGAPRSISFGDIYFSGDGLAECRHVFLDGNDLERRFAEARGPFVIGELGFGTGLNILAAIELWRREKKDPGARLEFLSIEKHPLRPADLRRAQAWPELAALSATLQAAYPPLVSGIHRLDLDTDVALTLVFGDAAGALPTLEAVVDAWFLDGFAPSKNPSMWRPEVAAELARLSAPGATAATFTVAGEARRTFEAAGFVVAKRAGYGRKREMLAARLSRQPQRSRRAPWFESDQRPLRRGAEVAVIGAGIAGASLACALSRVGLSPTLIDPLGIAGGASGNPAGLIMPRLDLGGTPAARFFRSAYVQAVAAIDRLDTDGAQFFNRCGALLKATSADGRLKQEKIAAAGLLPPDWMELRPDGLFFPQAGVIDPAKFCRRLAADAELVRARALTTQGDGDGVAVRFEDGARRSFDAVILANGREALRFFEARTLPLRGVMGQIDHFPDAETPPHAIAFGPYCAPAPAGGLIIGAANEAIAPGADAFVQASATRANIEALRAGAPEIADRLSAEYSRPRAAIRCQTPDRLPVVGPLPDWDAYGALYDDLRTGTRRDYAPGRMAHRRYVLSGLGSRGLVTAPLLAAILAAELTGAPSPVARDVAQALHPARFFIRDLRRARMKGSKPDLAEGSTRG